MTSSPESNVRFSTQRAFLRSHLGKDGAYLGVLIGLAAFVFSLFLSWTQAKNFTALEDQGYATGWSELGFLCLIPFIYVVAKVINNQCLDPKAVIVSSLLSLVALVCVNVAFRSEWISREYTTSYFQYGGSYRNFSGRSHSAGSDLGAGFWLGAAAILEISVAALTWSLHKVLEQELEIMPEPQPKNRTQASLEIPRKLIKEIAPAEVVRTSADYPPKAFSEENSTLSTFDKLNELARLKDRGALTSEEFQKQKALILTPWAAERISHKKMLTVAFAVVAFSVFAIMLTLYLHNNNAPDEVGSIQLDNANDAVSTIQSPVSGPTPSSEQPADTTPPTIEEAASSDDSAPVAVGECKGTTIATLASRLDGEPDSGSAITYTNSVYGVSYQAVPEVVNSRVGDRVSLCLESVPDNCPAGDSRGKVYKATNQRTGGSWSLPDSQHSCGGA